MPQKQKINVAKVNAVLDTAGPLAAEGGCPHPRSSRAEARILGL